MILSHKIDCDWVTTTGVHSFMTQDLVEQAKAKFSRLEGEKNADLKALAHIVTDTKELAALGVAAAKGAVVQKRAAALWPYKLVAFLLENLVREFGEEGNSSFSLQTNTPVTKIVHSVLKKADNTENISNGKVSNYICSSHRWVLHTPRGEVAAKKVLLCCNAYVSHLVPGFTGLIVPVRGQMAALKPPDTLKRHIGHSYVFIGHGCEKNLRDDYLIQRGANDGPSDGELLLGGGRDHDVKKGLGVSDDGAIDEHVAGYLRGELGRELDSIGTREPLEANMEWTGIMGYSRDGFPWVGQVPRILGGGCGLWVCGGYTGHGMPVAARCGKGVVEMMMGASAGIEIPQQFIITEKRIRIARTLDTVHMLDNMGFYL